MTEEVKSKKPKKKTKEEIMLESYTIETRIIDGKEVQVKVYKELKERPITQVCR